MNICKSCRWKDPVIGCIAEDHSPDLWVDECEDYEMQNPKTESDHMVKRKDAIWVFLMGIWLGAWIMDVFLMVMGFIDEDISMYIFLILAIPMTVKWFYHFHIQPYREKRKSSR